MVTDCSLVNLWLFPFLSNFRLGFIGSKFFFFFDWIRFIIRMKMKV